MGLIRGERLRNDRWEGLSVYFVSPDFCLLDAYSHYPVARSINQPISTPTARPTTRITRHTMDKVRSIAVLFYLLQLAAAPVCFLTRIVSRFYHDRVLRSVAWSADRTVRSRPEIGLPI